MFIFEFARDPSGLVLGIDYVGDFILDGSKPIPSRIRERRQLFHTHRRLGEKRLELIERGLAILVIGRLD